MTGHSGLAAALGALLVLGFLFVPGAALSLAVFGPGRLPVVTRIALVLPFGHAVVTALAFGLALVHGLTTALFLVTWGAVSAGLLLLAWFRSDLRGQPAALRRGVGEDPLGLWLAVAVGVVLFVAALFVDPVGNLGDYTPMRYWADGLEVAADRGIPELSMQWGQMLPAATSKVGLNAFDGAMSLLVGTEPFGAMQVLLVAATVSVAMAALALARELGLRLAAALFPLLLLGNLLVGPDGLTRDVHTYRAETWGRVAALAAAALAVRALRRPRGEPRLAVSLVAGGLFGVGLATHLVASAALGAFAIAYGLVVAVQGRAMHALWRVVRTGLVVSVAAVALGGGMLALAPGDPGFRGINDPAAYEDIVERLGLPEGFDPTVYLARGDLDQEEDGSHSQPAGAIADRFAGIAIGAPAGQNPLGWVVGLVVVAVLSAVTWLGPAALRATAWAAALLAATLIGVAIAFSLRYDVFALARFGERRLADYVAIAFWLLALALVEAGLLRLPQVRARAVAAVVVFVVTAGVLVPLAVRSEEDEHLASLLPALEWIEDNVPCGGRILADRRTLGTFEATVGRVGILEGMGPYFRPDVLEVALRAVLNARDFFADPEPGEAYLREQSVAVVVTTARLRPLLGGAHQLPGIDHRGLATAPFLERVVQTETATVYRVTSFDGGPRPPSNTPFCREDEGAG